jgi:hypothetical protein
LCEDNQITVNEIWSFHGMGDDVRFTLVHRTREVAPPPRRAAPAPTPAVPTRRKPPAPASRRSVRPAKAGPRGKAVKKTARSPKRK